MMDVDGSTLGLLFTLVSCLDLTVCGSSSILQAFMLISMLLYSCVVDGWLFHFSSVRSSSLVWPVLIQIQLRLGKLMWILVTKELILKCILFRKIEKNKEVIYPQYIYGKVGQILIFGPIPNTNLFEKSNFWYLYTNIQYSE